MRTFLNPHGEKRIGGSKHVATKRRCGQASRCLRPHTREHKKRRPELGGVLKFERVEVVRREAYTEIRKLQFL
jgi:hypothetical protein